MWRLYDALIEGIDDTRRVDYACCGAWRAWVESEGRAGMASLLAPGMVVSAPTGELAQYRGKKLRDMAALAKSWDPREASLGVAAINAYYNDVRTLEFSKAQLFSIGGENGDVFAQMLPYAKDKKVATIGHFNGIDQLYGPVCEFTVFEREPRPGDLPDTAEEYLLPRMDLVFITGMALTNKTLPRLLQLTSGCRVVMTGPSTPLTGILFDFGVDVVSGLAVADIKAGLAAVQSDHWHDIYEAARRVVWYKQPQE